MKVTLVFCDTGNSDKGGLSAVSGVLARNNIKVIRTYFLLFLYSRVKFYVSSYDALNKLIVELNDECVRGVAVRKVKYL